MECLVGWCRGFDAVSSGACGATFLYDGKQLSTWRGDGAFSEFNRTLMSLKNVTKGADADGRLRAEVEELEIELSLKQGSIKRMAEEAPGSLWDILWGTRHRHVMLILQEVAGLDLRLSQVRSNASTHIAAARAAASAQEMRAASEAEEAAARTALVAAWEDEYAATISRVVEKLEAWKQTYGRHYAVHLYKDPAMEEEVDKARTDLLQFWRKPQDQDAATPGFMAAFLSGKWLHRAVHYRMLAEQLDVVYYYRQGKNLDSDYLGTITPGRHYTDGLDSPDEYVRNAETRALEGVKASAARPERFRLIQEQELARIAGRPASSLEVARLLKQLGAGEGAVRFQDYHLWPEALKAALPQAQP